KSTKKSHKPKSEDTNQEKLYLLHMDLYGPMRVESVNGKKYILVIVDDYSRFTWVKFLRSKDETPMFIIKFLKMIQVRLNVPVRPRTMLIYTQAPLFLWAEVVATAFFTQNRSIIRLRHRKTPYELIHGKQPDLSYFHVFGALCYPTNDGENVGKLQPKDDIGIFIGYVPTKKAFRIYNRRTRRLVQKPSSSTSYVPPTRNDWDLLFQSLFDELLNPPPSVDNQDIEVIAPIVEDLLFQPLFDELLNPPPSVDNQDIEVIAPIAEVIPQDNDDSTGSPSSTAVDQDAPSPSNSLTPIEIQSTVIP
nr:hypothetical protein [Tanacetum cinerariifolium]